MRQIIKKLVLPLLFFASFPINTYATEGITIRPFLIDETLTSRQDSQKLITVKNDYDYRKVVLYATVNEISVDKDGVIKEFVTPVMTDQTNTVTSWIEISRGRIEIPIGESREIPLTIRLNPFAQPGVYHVFIGFVEAPNRPEAEAVAMAGDADGVIVKVTVADNRVDSLKISGFSIERFVTGKDKRGINVEVENVGDIPSVPEGEIIFYDSRGIELSSVPVKGESVPPGEKINITSEIPLTNKIGRFKANLVLKYGEDQSASLHDTTFFYLIPLKLVILIFFSVLAISISVVLLLRRVFLSPATDDSFSDVTMYVKEGHEPNPKDHDINLKKSN